MTKILVDKLVLEQALEALECVDLQSLVPDYGSGHYSVSRLDGPHLKSAITTLRAALAEPVQESVKLPTTATEAELMAKMGLMWLEQNAPDRLLKPVAKVPPRKFPEDNDD